MTRKLKITDVRKILNMPLKVKFRWRDGLKHRHKNKYCIYKKTAIVKLTKRNYLLCDWDNITKKILSDHIFNGSDYPYTNIWSGKSKKTSIFIHLYLEHIHKTRIKVKYINKNSFDNRLINLKYKTPEAELEMNNDKPKILKPKTIHKFTQLPAIYI